MIKGALEKVQRELEEFFGDGVDVILDSLKNIQDKSGLFISLLAVEEESTLKNTPHYVKHNHRNFYKEPPIYLNLKVLISFAFTQYDTSLERLSQTILFFQNHKKFHLNSPSNPDVANDQPDLIVELLPLGFEQLNHIWGISGESHQPCLLYGMRIVKIQANQELEAPEIDTIQMNTSLLSK